MARLPFQLHNNAPTNDTRRVTVVATLLEDVVDLFAVDAI